MKKFLYHGKKNICGDRIRLARLGKRLSQTDLARMLQLQGVPAERDIISRMEIGDRLVTDYEVVTIAEVLDVSVVWLLGKEERTRAGVGRTTPAFLRRGCTMNYKGFHHLKWEDRLKIEGALKTGGRAWRRLRKCWGCAGKTIYNEIEAGPVPPAERGLHIPGGVLRGGGGAEVPGALTGEGAGDQTGPGSRFRQLRGAEDHRGPLFPRARCWPTSRRPAWSLKPTSAKPPFIPTSTGGRVPGPDGGTPAV